MFSKTLKCAFGKPIGISLRAYRIVQFHILKYVRTIKVVVRAESVILPVYIGGVVSINTNTRIGRFVSINGLTVKGFGFLNIHDFVHFGTDCLIITSNHNYEYGLTLPYDATEVIKTIEIGRAVWIGDRVTIIGNIVIGEGAIIQAGAVVVNNIPPYGIVGGNPAVVFKYRDQKHYERLASEDKFYRW